MGKTGNDTNVAVLWVKRDVERIKSYALLRAQRGSAALATGTHLHGGHISELSDSLIEGR